MATLFERLVGIEGTRIPIHGVVSAFWELHRGHLTVPNIIAMFNLDAPQQTDMQTLWQAISNSADPAARINEFEQFLKLGEITNRTGGSDYTEASIFWARINGFS